MSDQSRRGFVALLITFFLVLPSAPAGAVTLPWNKCKAPRAEEVKAAKLVTARANAVAKRTDDVRKFVRSSSGKGWGDYRNLQSNLLAALDGLISAQTTYAYVVTGNPKCFAGSKVAEEKDYLTTGRKSDQDLYKSLATNDGFLALMGRLR